MAKYKITIEDLETKEVTCSKESNLIITSVKVDNEVVCKFIADGVDAINIAGFIRTLEKYIKEILEEHPTILMTYQIIKSMEQE